MQQQEQEQQQEQQRRRRRQRRQGQRHQQPTALVAGLLLLVVLVVLCGIRVAEGVTLEVPPRGRVCMYQYYEAGDSGRAEVFVVNGGNLDIRLTVEGPFKDDAEGSPLKETQETRVVYDEVVSSSSSFTNREDHPPGVLATADGLELSWAARGGAYAVCLDNGMSQMQTKVVEFALPSPKSAQGEDDFDLEAAIAAAEAEEGAGAAAAGNGTIPENIKQSYKADLALLKKSADRIGRTLKDVQRKQMKERHRLALQTAANENNHNKMVVSSLFETVVFIGVSVFQLFYVRRWFEGRGLQGERRGGSRQWA